MTVDSRRRAPTPEEAKALAHPLRLRILRAAAQRDVTNKQLADELDATPGTVLFHVRVLLRAGLLVSAPVRSGESGALEKPYRSTGVSWWLSDSLAGTPDVHLAPVRLFLEEATRATPDDLATFAAVTLHMSEDDVRRLDRELLEVIDQWVLSDEARRDRPVHRGLVAWLRLPEESMAAGAEES